MSETTELAVVERQEVKLSSAASFAEVGERMALVKRALREIMEKGLDYGTIPGCGPKDCLFKAGAEKLKTLFQLGFMVVDKEIRDLGDGHREVEMTLRFTHLPTGWIMGDGVGSCNTRERRMQRDKGTAADVYNNCLKLAKKRALVDGILTVTGSSGFLTQDVEDDPELYQKEQPGRPPLPKAPQRTKPATNGNGHTNGTDPLVSPADWTLGKAQTLKGKVERAWPNEYQGQRYYFAKLNGYQLQTLDMAQGGELLSAIGQEIQAVVEASPKPGKFYLKGLILGNGQAKPKDEVKRSPWEELQRFLAEADLDEKTVLATAKQLQIIPDRTPKLSGLAKPVYGDLIESWPDIDQAIRQAKVNGKEDK